MVLTQFNHVRESQAYKAPVSVDEFDVLVDAFNSYQDRLKESKKQEDIGKLVLKTIVDGLSSVIHLFKWNYPIHETMMRETGNPLYVHKGLDDDKRDLIMQASRLKKDLDCLECTINSLGIELAERNGSVDEKEMMDKAYGQFKKKYCDCTRQND